MEALIDDGEFVGPVQACAGAWFRRYFGERDRHRLAGVLVAG
jgi:hypothetical protein